MVLFGSGSDETSTRVQRSCIRISNDSPLPLMLFGGSRPRHLDTTCIHECVTSPVWESHMQGHPGVLPISDQKALILSAFARTPCPRISGTCSSGGGAGGGTVGISLCAVAVGISSSGREVTGGPDIPESISTSKFHFVPRASTVSRRLHCSPGGFLRTDLHFSKPCFVANRCSSNDASRLHQQLIQLFVSLAARTSWSGINANTDSPNMHKGDT